jgi:DNA-binding MarR family transcriptional regulator
MGSHSLDDDVRAVMDGIRHVVRELRVSGRASERLAGLSGAQVFVLQQLAEAGPCSIGDLALRTSTHQSSVSTVVSRLEERGLVRRKPSEEDRRRVDVVVTSAGLGRLRDAPSLAQTRLIAALHQMEPTLRSGLRDGLAALVGAVADTSVEPPLFFEDDAASDPGSR